MSNHLVFAELISTDELAKMLAISTRTIKEFDKEGFLPESVIIGKRLKRWRSQDILDWIALGCPPRNEFEKTQSIMLRVCRSCPRASAARKQHIAKQANEDLEV